jgi:hypothetical protein
VLSCCSYFTFCPSKELDTFLPSPPCRVKMLTLFKDSKLTCYENLLSEAPMLLELAVRKSKITQQLSQNEKDSHDPTASLCRQSQCGVGGISVLMKCPSSVRIAS